MAQKLISTAFDFDREASLTCNLIKIRSFDPLPLIATKGSNEIPVQSREYLASA